ncbi:twin-arginine translocation signal domain-containing protein [Frateuria aurantia]
MTDRRRFIQHLALGGVAAGLGSRRSDAAPTAPQQPSSPPPLTPPRMQPITADLPAGLVQLTAFDTPEGPVSVHEDFNRADGDLRLRSPRGECLLSKRVETVAPPLAHPYLGLSLREVAESAADLLADQLLAAGEPDEARVRSVAPPPASHINPADYYGRLPWTTFVGTRQCQDTMPVYPQGSTRTYHPEQTMPGLHGNPQINHRDEGLLGGWLPAVHKVIPMADNAWYDILVFADVRADDQFIAQTWHRTLHVENGRITAASYGHSYPTYGRQLQPPRPAEFYRALYDFVGYWQQQLADLCPVTLPDASWADLSRFAFARELVVRPGGTYPKYGAVDRDYYGSEYDGFQDIFTSSLYANLEWGRFEQASDVLDGYFTDFVSDSGMINMRGAETAQFGLTLSLLTRYFRYTGDRVMLMKHRGKIEATANILHQLRQESLELPVDHPGHGLIHGWNESDACLFPDPSLWWKPYYANSAMAVRGLLDLAQVWPDIGGSRGQAEAWAREAKALQTTLLQRLRANIRTDLKPPYIGPLPGVTLTFRQSLASEKPSEQQWPHRAYSELLQADVLPDELAHLVIDCLRGHGGTVLGVVGNIGPVDPGSRDMLGFISYGYAQQLLRLDRIDEYVLFMYSHRYYAHTRGSWTAAEVSDISGGMPLFCMPAQLTSPLLLRWALVFEDSLGESLYLARGVPRAWIASGRAISIEQAPTRWGRVDLKLQFDIPQAELNASIRLPQAAHPERLQLSLRGPHGLQLEAVTINGQPASAGRLQGEALRLDGLTPGPLNVRAKYRAAT